MSPRPHSRSTALRALPAAGALLAAASLAACGSGDVQGPDIPDFTGTYEGTWTIRMEAQDLSERREARCPGAVEVTAQTDTSFSGSFRMEPGGETSGDISCREVTGRFVDAGIGSGGLASFRLRSGDRSGSTALTGCEGQDLWQGDFARTPGLPERAQFEAGIRVDVRCEEGDGPEIFRSQINFSGRAQ